MDAYRDELAAAQQRIESLEGKIQAQAGEIEELQDALKRRDEHLKKLRKKFEGARAKPWHSRPMWAIGVVAMSSVVATGFALLARRAAQPPPASSTGAPPFAVCDAGITAPTACARAGWMMALRAG
jgi:uncharacterized coiled-coil protein SlyX